MILFSHIDEPPRDGTLAKSWEEQVGDTISLRFDQITSQAEILAQDRFAFLVERRGFARGPTKHTSHSTLLYYVCTPELGLEVELNFREAFIGVHMVRLRAGKPPRQQGDWAGNECIRTNIPYLLQTVLAVNDPWLDDTIRGWRTSNYIALSDGYRFAQQKLTDLKDIVERHIDLILQQPMDVLFPPRNSASNFSR